MSLSAGQSSSCPFCKIASSYAPCYPPHLPTALRRQTSQCAALAPSKPSHGESGHSHLILSTNSVLAFLDIMPLTKGHVLLITREHYEKLDEMDVRTAREIGQWLPMLSRVIMKTVFGPDESRENMHWNVVQNNGARAAQQVPHLHFHIVPRPATPTTGRFAAAGQGSFAMFGRGQRHDLDEEEGDMLAQTLREELAREVQKVQDAEGVDLVESLGFSVGQRGLWRLGKL